MIAQLLNMYFTKVFTTSVLLILKEKLISHIVLVCLNVGYRQIYSFFTYFFVQSVHEKKSFGFALLFAKRKFLVGYILQKRIVLSFLFKPIDLIILG